MCWVRGVRYMDAWERDACVRVGRSRGWRAAWETDAVGARVGGERDAGGKMCVCAFRSYFVSRVGLLQYMQVRIPLLLF